MPVPLNLAQNGYVVLFLLVLAEAVGLPVPAALALLIAGGSTARHPSHLIIVLATALSALLVGDSLLFVLGRYSGWWLLGILCKLSLNPDSCMLRAAEAFYRRGRTLLLLAKFVPGINSLAPPLAGSMNMRYAQFFPFDLGGASLYALVWCGAGFLFSDFLSSVTSGYRAASRILIFCVVLAALAYFGYRLWRLLRAGPLSYVPRVSVAEVARQFYSDIYNDMVVFDVRSHGYYNGKASRIKGSQRLEPNTILHQLDELPKDKEIVLYCTCHREATSIRIARILQQHGFRASVIKGGLRAWKRSKFPLETVPQEDVIFLPTF